MMVVVSPSWPGRERLVGVGWSLLSALLWSTTFVAGRFLLADGKVDPVTLSACRFVLGGGLLLGVGVLTWRRTFFAITGSDYARLALLGLLGIVGMSVLLFHGQQSTTATNSAIIMQLNPIVICLLGLFIGEWLSARRVLGIAVALAGCLLALGVLTSRGVSIDKAHLTGDLYVLASACCWALYTVLGKGVVTRLGGFRATTWAMVFGAVELLVLYAVLPVPHVWPVSGGAWLVIVYLAIFPTAIAFVAWYEAMRHIPLALLNVMQYLTPPTTLLLAWLLLGERLTPGVWIGFALILAGVAIVGAADHRRLVKLPEPLPVAPPTNL